MGPEVEAALIAAVSAGGVATISFVINLQTTTRTLEAARDQRLWDKQAEIYAEVLAFVAHRKDARDRSLKIGQYTPAQHSTIQRILDSYEPPSWYELQGRVLAFASDDVFTAFEKARNKDESASQALLLAVEAGKLARADGAHGDPAFVYDRAEKVVKLCHEAEQAENLLVNLVHAQLHRNHSWRPRRRLFFYR